MYPYMTQLLVHRLTLTVRPGSALQAEGLTFQECGVTCLQVESEPVCAQTQCGLSAASDLQVKKLVVHSTVSHSRPAKRREHRILEWEAAP